MRRYSAQKGHDPGIGVSIEISTLDRRREARAGKTKNIRSRR